MHQKDTKVGDDYAAGKPNVALSDHGDWHSHKAVVKGARVQTLTDDGDPAVETEERMGFRAIGCTRASHVAGISAKATRVTNYSTVLCGRCRRG